MATKHLLNMAKPIYRGSPKHKKRPGQGRKGTLCPEWTHVGLGNAPTAHQWDGSAAQEMFNESELDPTGSGKRYATMKGVAFAAQDTADGTWHGYPEPWQKVPADLKDKWLDNGKVTRADLRRYKDFPKDNIHWALDSNDG